MTVPDATEVLVAAIHRWLEDPDSAVVYAEQVEDRWAVRMTQDVRDATTVWWEPGARTLGMEAYLGPIPEHAAIETYRLLLVVNRDTRHCAFALDREGGAVVRARIRNGDVDLPLLDAVLGECYAMIERAFPLVVGLFRRRPRTP